MKEPQKGWIKNLDARIVVPSTQVVIVDPVAAKILVQENEKLKVVIALARKRIETAINKFNMLGSSKSKIDNAKRLVEIELFLEQSLLLLNEGNQS